MTVPALQVVYVDTETTGLDPDLDPIWEVAAIRLVFTGWEERRWFLPIDVGCVSDWVRDNCGFADRYDLADLTPTDRFLDEFEQFVDGRHMVGNVISFDAERLGRLYRAAGRDVPWHYHLIDVEPCVVGRLAGFGRSVELPWNSHDLSEAVGVPVPDGRHEAMVDARWARDVFCAATDPTLKETS